MGEHTPRSDGYYDYFLDPTDSWETPENYIGPFQRSELVRELLDEHVGTDARLLEVGIGAGANLAHFFANGYRDLTGIELNPEMVETFRREHPDAFAATDVREGTALEVLPTFEDDEFDVTVALTILAHIPPDAEEVFDHLLRVTADTLVVVENEFTVDDIFVPRNYREVFTSRGWEQVDFVPRQVVSERTELSGNCRARVFEPPTSR